MYFSSHKFQIENDSSCIVVDEIDDLFIYLFVYCLTDWLINWLIVWLINWLIDWSFDRLIWLTDYV